MKLIELSCDHSSFKTIKFNPDGLTLIVGERSIGEKKESSSNGVGKTLALGLIHHCLAANLDDKLKAAVPDWIFRLTFSLNREEHFIERSGDGKKLLLDGKNIKVRELRKWLDNCGVFRIDPNISYLSFRSLFRRFSRHLREDCIDPLRTKEERDFELRLRSLYLLGIDYSLILSKRSNKIELDNLNQSLKNWQNDEVLKEIFRSGAQPKVRSEWLDREIPRLKDDLDCFQVADDYRITESQASELTRKMREYGKEIAVIQFQMEGIEKSLSNQPDISQSELLELYNGLQNIFKPEVLAHFDAVEKFHQSLTANRKARLEQDRIRLNFEKERLEKQRDEIAGERDQKLQTLQGKRALDEYATVARQLATLEEERQRLNEFLNFSATLKQRIQKIREKKVEEDRIASEYILTNPLAQSDRYFTGLAELLYPRTPAGIVLESNTGDNQLRYDLTIQIEGDDSDGINAARILCFDWLLLMHGSNHSMGFLWHDNRLFADIDPHPRATWFVHAMESLSKTGKQYIATINTENFVAMKEYLTNEQKKCIDDAVILTLYGDKTENKLLGIQFGS